MRLAIMIVIAVTTSMSTASHAKDCPNAVSQMELNACAGNEFQAADARLNTTWNEVVNRLRGQDEARKLLVASELAWVRFRDAECAFATNRVRGGSIHPMIQSSCETEMTKDRTKRLREYLDCREGDLSCPLSPR